MPNVTIVSHINNELTFKISSMEYNLQILANELDGLVVKNSNGHTYGSFRADDGINSIDTTTVYISFSDGSLTLLSRPLILGDYWAVQTQIFSLGLVGSYTYFITTSSSNLQNIEVYKDSSTCWSSNSGTCKCSITEKYSSKQSNIPNYKYFNTTTNRSVNTLNNIAMILPVYIYVKSSPSSLNLWEYLDKIPALGCVNMYNMNEFHIAQSSYNNTGDKYICCSLNGRSFLDYSGIAIKLTDKLTITEDDVNVIPSIQ